MSNEASRKALHAYVTDNAHDQWHGFAAERGVSVSAILEALAPALDDTEEASDEGVVEIGNVIHEARKIDARRRRRRR